MNRNGRCNKLRNSKYPSSVLTKVQDTPRLGGPFRIPKVDASTSHPSPTLKPFRDLCVMFVNQ